MTERLRFSRFFYDTARKRDFLPDADTGRSGQWEADELHRSSLTPLPSCITDRKVIKQDFLEDFPIYATESFLKDAPEIGGHCGNTF